MKTKVKNIFYELRGEIHGQTKLVTPVYCIQEEKKNKYEYLISHFKERVTAKHCNIASFLNVIIEIENHPDYDCFLKTLIKISEKLQNNIDVEIKNYFILDFNFLFEIFVSDLPNNSINVCKVGIHFIFTGESDPPDVEWITVGILS